MCLAVYLASDTALPPIEWKESSPAFYLEPIPASDIVAKQFSLPNLYYAGSHEGCGCGFFKDGKTDHTLEEAQANYSSLAAVLRSSMPRGAMSEIFICWEGEQAHQPTIVQECNINDIEDPSFEFQQLQLLRVHSSGA
jgi:hypothetical protein